VSIIRQITDTNVMVWIPGRPVAAARPRVARNGGRFYPKTYTKYLKDTRALLAEQTELTRCPWFPVKLDDKGRRIKHLTASIHLHSHRLLRGDVDNYAKAVLDASQGTLIEDDFSIRDLHIFSDVNAIEKEGAYVEFFVNPCVPRSV
jgi:Holliday junction resolvase RusA-like endonuclease